MGIDNESSNGCAVTCPLTQNTSGKQSLQIPEGHESKKNKSSPIVIAILSVIVAILSAVLIYIILTNGACIGVTWPWKNHDESKNNTKSTELKSEPEKYTRLPNNLMPDHYEVFVKVQMPDLVKNVSLSFNGSVVISITVADRTNQIKLNAHKALNIISKHLQESSTNRSVTIKSTDYIASEDMLIFHLGRYLNPSETLSLFISFSSSPAPTETEGLYAGAYYQTFNNQSLDSTDGPEIRWFAVTQMEPAAARKMFPCFDEPLFKAVFSITVLHESKFRVLSNMPAISEEPLEDKGWTRVQFEPTVRMSTYLVALSITTFKSRRTTVKNMRNETVPIRVWARTSEIEHTDYALKVAADSYVFFEDFYQIPYALPKMDLISVPNFNVGGMENWGLITFRPFYLISAHTELSHYGICKVVNHEIAHQWFGNLVTPVWWNDIWLNEGFATFMEYVGMDAIEKDWDVWSLFFVDVSMEVFSSDSLLSSHPTVHEEKIKNRDDLKMFFDLISYRKGGAILGMLKVIMGEDGFKKGVLNFLDTFQFSSATSNDLWNSFEQSRNTTEIPYPINDMMRQWTLQLGYPLVSINATYHDNKIVVSMSQKHFLTNEKLSREVADNEDVFWHVKLDFSTNFGYIASSWLTAEPQQFEIELKNKHANKAVKYVLANSRCEHFYRVNYDFETWKRIVEALRLEPWTFDSATRACLVDNSWQLAAANVLKVEIALNLTVLAVMNDTSLPVWKTVSHHLENTFALMYRSGRLEKFREYCVLIVDLATNASIKNGPASFESLRKEYINDFANLIIDHPRFVQESNEMVDDWMNKLDAEDANYIHDCHLCAAVRNRSLDFAYELYKLVDSNPNHRLTILRGVACTNDAAFFNQVLERVIRECNNEWRIDELGYFLISGAGHGNTAAFNVLWNYFSTPEKFDMLGPLFKDFTFFFKNILFAVYAYQDSEFAPEAMRKFNETRYNQLGAGQAEFYRLIEMVENNVQWSHYTKPQVIDWLDNIFEEYHNSVVF